MHQFNVLLHEIPFVNPIQIFSLFEQERYSFFLDSGTNKYDLGRYSFIGFSPFMVFKSKGTRIEIRGSEFGDGIIDKELIGDPFEILRQLTNQYKLNPVYYPFLGGAVGYFGYEMRHLIEDLHGNATDDLGIPDCVFCFYDLIIIFDLLIQKAYLCSNGFPEQGRLRQIRAKERAKEALKRLSLIPKLQAISHKLQHYSKNIVSNFTMQEYLKAVNQAKEYIAAGDIYQVNLSQRLRSILPISSFYLYKRLRILNPAPFASFLNLDNITIVSASPERFLSLRGQTVETRPIKGTRTRGKTKAQDVRLRNELKRSEKDRAELIMIIDLLRNDIGRVCQYGSVRVKELIKLETHPTVFHTVSIINGQLKEECDRFDLIKACFPGGSITGAPKIRAMEIIDELEPTKRHIYTGSLGYLSFTGAMDLNIIIRTFLVKKDTVYFQIGGGIVADSIAEDEYQETLDKGKALIEALQIPASCTQFPLNN